MWSGKDEWRCPKSDACARYNGVACVPIRASRSVSYRSAVDCGRSHPGWVYQSGGRDRRHARSPGRLAHRHQRPGSDQRPPGRPCLRGGDLSRPDGRALRAAGCPAESAPAEQLVPAQSMGTGAIPKHPGDPVVMCCCRAHTCISPPSPRRALNSPPDLRIEPVACDLARATRIATQIRPADLGVTRPHRRSPGEGSRPGIVFPAATANLRLILGEGTGAVIERGGRSMGELR